MTGTLPGRPEIEEEAMYAGYSIVQAVADEHIKDMHAHAAAARLARQVRRARREGQGPARFSRRARAGRGPVAVTAPRPRSGLGAA